MKYTALLAALAALLIANQSANAQGALAPAGAPAESQKSLQEIYDAIQSARADFEAAKAEFATLVQQAVPSVPGMVTVLGGTLPEASELAGEVVSTFYIGKYEVTWDEWQTVKTWAVANGYSDLLNVGAGNAGNHPVRNVSWYDVLKWSNAKSQMEGLMPVYTDNGTIFKTGQSLPIPNPTANGYRLPAEAEWEWAARGGIASKGYTYSGSNDVDAVAWYSGNSEGGTKIVGSKTANEIGIFDMSGNVWEWCIESVDSNRRTHGGAWDYFANGCVVGSRQDGAGGQFVSSPTGRFESVGFRLARSY